MNNELTQQVVRELLEYDAETGVLTWKIRDRSWFDRDRVWKTWNKRYANTPASYIYTAKSGYQRRDMKLLGRKYPSHRIIWLWVTGSWPKESIDHIDRDATNNRWNNLREADAGQNARNRAKHSNNTSGYTGVSWNKFCNKWQAQVWANGRNNHLGYFDEKDLELAAKVAMEFRARQGFEPTHGLDTAPYRTLIKEYI